MKPINKKFLVIFIVFLFVVVFLYILLPKAGVYFLPDSICSKYSFPNEPSDKVSEKCPYGCLFTDELAEKPSGYYVGVDPIPMPRCIGW